MSAEKEYFDIPLVRIPLDKIRFPRICPICGKEATKPARIITTPGRKRYLSASWDPALHPATRRSRIATPPPKTLLLYVCEDHYQSDEGDTNYKLFCLICDGILGAIFVFAALMIGGALWMGMPIAPATLFFVIAFFAAVIITILAFRAGPLANAVQIVGFDPGGQYTWIQLKSERYRDAFMDENAMNAELVKWIARVKS